MFEQFTPAGLRIDKRSTPKFLWLFKPRDGMAMYGAGPHDPEYMTTGFTKNMDLGCFAQVNGIRCTMTRRACDQHYQHANDKRNPHSIDDETDYVGLRIFGKLFKYWGKRKR